MKVPAICVIYGWCWILSAKVLTLLQICSVGAKHQSHQDYLEKADKARSQRLSSSGASSAKWCESVCWSV